MFGGISRAVLLLTALFGTALWIAACATPPPSAPADLSSRPEATGDIEISEGAYLLEMEPLAGGYRLGSTFELDDPENERFEYRGAQAGHVVYHRKLLSHGESSEFTDILLHVGPGAEVNKIVLLKQFSSLENARAFYDRQYRRQREEYYLTEDSGNSGNIRFAQVEAYPDRASWRAAYDRYSASDQEGPFLYYYHPLIARRTANFVYLRGIPTVALIYESHRYGGGVR